MKVLNNFNKYNNTISLALGSGSSKGIAHIGVIETFLKRGYNIEAIAGTSAGAIIGAYYVTGKLGILKSWISSMDKKKTFRNMDFSITGGFISGNKLLDIFEEHIGDIAFEEVDIPFYIVATNLDLGEVTIFNKGKIVPAIRASISVPGVIKPFYYNGYYYVDGAVSNPVPVDVLKDNKHHNIIAVHLNSHVEERSNEEPGLLETTGRSMGLVAKFLADAKMDGAKAIITPELYNIGMFDLYKSSDIITVGSKATEELLDSNIMKTGLKDIIIQMFRL